MQQGIYDGLDNRKDPNQRDYASMCVFGDLGRGKSTFLSQYAKLYIQKTEGKKVPRRVLIIDPSKAAGFRGYPGVTLAELKYGVINPKTKAGHVWETGIKVLRDENWSKPEWIGTINKYFRNGLVILDESRQYIPEQGKLPDEYKEFFTVHRNNCVDVMLVSHDYMNLHLWLRKAFRVYIVFQTGDRPTHEGWMTQRSLPEPLYEISLLLQKLWAPASKMSPFVYYDKVTGCKRLYFDEPKALQVKVPVGDGLDHRLMSYLEYLKKTR